MPAYVPLATVERPQPTAPSQGQSNGKVRLTEKYDVQGNLVLVSEQPPPPRAPGDTPVAHRTRGTEGPKNRKAELYVDLNSHNTALGRLYQDVGKAFQTLHVAHESSNTLTLTALKTTFSHLKDNAKVLQLQFQYMKDETKLLRPKEIMEATMKHTRLVTLTKMLYRFATTGDMIQLWKKTWSAIQLTIDPASETIPAPEEFDQDTDSGSEAGDVNDEEIPRYLVDTTPLAQNDEHVNPVRHPQSLNNPANKHLNDPRLSTTVRYASVPPPAVQRSDVLTYEEQRRNSTPAGNEPDNNSRNDQAQRQRSRERSRRRSRSKTCRRSRSRSRRRSRTRRPSRRPRSRSHRRSRYSTSRTPSPRGHRRHRSRSHSHERRSKRSRTKSPAPRPTVNDPGCGHCSARHPQPTGPEPIASSTPNPPVTRSPQSDQALREAAAQRQREKFAVAAGETVRIRQPPVTPKRNPKTPNDLSPVAVYAELAEALASGTTKERLMEILYETDKNKSNNMLQQEPTKVTKPLPPGWFNQKVPDLFDKQKKTFKKYCNELGLTKFSGTEDSITFPAWWQLFCRQIHALPETYASDPDKLWALGELTVGRPRKLIDGWVGSDKPDDYKLAVQQLQAAFGDNEKAKHKLKLQLNEMRPPSMKASALSNFLANVNTTRRNLIHAGMSEYQASDEAMEAVVRVMAVPYVNQYLSAIGLFGKVSPSSFYAQDPEQHFVDFMQWFLQLSHYVNESDDEDDSGINMDSSMVMATRAQTESKKPENKSNKSTQNQKNTTPASSSKPNNRQTLQRVFVCVFCTKNHKNDYCTHDVATRITIAERLQLCRCCLKKGHQQSDCPSDNTCCHCAKKGLWRQHNTALCNSPEALAARMQGLTIDWAEYRKTKKSDPNYAKYKAQLLKKRLEKAPKEIRAQLAQVLIEVMSSDEEDEVPTNLETSKDASSSTKTDPGTSSSSEQSTENDD